MGGSSLAGTDEEDILAVVALVACLGNRPIAAVAVGSKDDVYSAVDVG